MRTSLANVDCPFLDVDTHSAACLFKSGCQSVNRSCVSPSEIDPEQPCSYCSQPQECPSSVPWAATVFFQSVLITSELSTRMNYTVRGSKHYLEHNHTDLSLCSCKSTNTTAIVFVYKADKLTNHKLEAYRFVGKYTRET